MKPWTFFLTAMAGWMNRRQQEVIEYLKEENRVLRETLGPKRLLLSDQQKRRLAVKGKTLVLRPVNKVQGPVLPIGLLVLQSRFVFCR